jgi:rhamnose utilization protein RhaD (predicted bifunctional aldolase and dehydrogenase)
MSGMNQLIQMSRKYGSNPDYVLAGGGNTSFKDGNVLFVKASGTTLATIEETGFVAMDRNLLQKMWTETYSIDSATREAEVLRDLMASRQKGQVGRPSVETALHDLIDYPFVLHLHPALVNGVTCSRDDKTWVQKNFNDEVIWLDATKPGFLLAAVCRTLIQAYKTRFGKPAHILLIENHGVFFGADTLEEMDDLVDGLMNRIRRNKKNQLAVPGFNHRLRNQSCDPCFI